jgi:hypothetical protein
VRYGAKRFFTKERGSVHPFDVRELNPTTIRLDEQMKKDVDRVAEMGGVAPADVIRMCVKHGLPIVEHGFAQMNAFLETKTPYNLAQFQNAGKTALEAGHSEQMLFNHYRELVTSEEAAAFWAITPQTAFEDSI